MTAIFYPDCQATSPNGTFTLEARSPHNGAIKHRDGRSVSENEFGFKYREHQSEFRYQLLDNSSTNLIGRLLNRRVTWERWQRSSEDSPHEIVVSDEGWSILRTHGFRPEVIAVSPTGKDVLCVRIGGDGPERRSSWPEGTVFTWGSIAAFTSAGNYWSMNSWRYFFQYQGSLYFVWRTSSGQRLVIDLDRARILSEADQSNRPFALALVEQETKGVYEFLASLSRQMTEIRRMLVEIQAKDRDREQHPMLEQIRSAKSALHLAGVHKIKGCIPFLREWESIDLPSVSSGSSAMTEHWWLEVQSFRPIAHHSLRLLGEEPLGYPTYHFRIMRDLPDGANHRFPMPERVADRQKRLQQLDKQMSAEEVLKLLGSPDHIKRNSYQEGKIYRWTEDWEYDFRTAKQWTTLRITWKEENRKGLIDKIEEIPPYWLHSDERESEILQF